MTDKLILRAEDFALRQLYEASSRILGGIKNAELLGSLFGDHLEDQLKFAYESGAKAERERIWFDIATELIVRESVPLEELKRVLFEGEK